MPPSTSSAWAPDTLRCNGITTHRSAAPISPRCVPTVNPVRGREPARSSPTASNTRSPKDAWRRRRPLLRPATADRYAECESRDGSSACRVARFAVAHSESQSGEALLDFLGGQPVVGQRVLVLGSPGAALAFGMALFHRLPRLVGQRDIEVAVNVGHRPDWVSDQRAIVDVVELARVVFGASGIEPLQTARPGFH